MKNIGIDMSTQKFNKKDIVDSNTTVKLNEADTIGAWWAFFGTKEILLGVTAVTGILALFKVFGNTIKGRFRKCAKMLFTMQKDFGTAENGMDMNSVLPGVGSKITDWITRFIGLKRGNGANKGALGLRPFVTNYINEIGADYNEALKSFDVVQKANNDERIRKRDQATGAVNNLKRESVDTIYTSFTEARKNMNINESERPLYEDVSFDNGSYIVADGNERKKVEVNKQSTREICYSIMGMFCDKYFNMKSVSNKLGIDLTALDELDASSVEKFKKICHAMKAPVAEGSDNKMYARIRGNYNQMVDAYIRIATTVVNNFEKYTKLNVTKDNKQLSEKDSNLLVASKEKLIAEVHRQEDAYKNNFFRVMNAIISSPEYISYINFILESVIPVFESGEAEEAQAVDTETNNKTKLYIKDQTNIMIYAFGESSSEESNTNIDKIIIASIKKGTKLNADVKVNNLTAGRIDLNTNCTLEQFDSKFKTLGFAAQEKPADNIIAYIEKCIENNVGTNSEKLVQAQSIDLIEDSINNLTGSTNQQGNQQQQLEQLATAFFEKVEQANIIKTDISALTYAVSLKGGSNKDFYTVQKTGNQVGTGINSGIQNNGKDVMFNIYPVLIDDNLNLVKPDANKAPQGKLGILITIAAGLNANVQYHIAEPTEESIKKAYIETVQECQQKFGGQQESQNTKFTIEYSVNESVADKITVSRTVKTSLNGTYYILSETMWGDGTELNPVAALQKSMSKLLKENMTYDDIAAFAKNSANINFIKASDTVYNVRPSKNRFGMLTSANPLYENAVAVKFDKSGALKKVYNIGIQKITV